MLRQIFCALGMDRVTLRAHVSHECKLVVALLYFQPQKVFTSSIPKRNLKRRTNKKKV